MVVIYSTVPIIYTIIVIVNSDNYGLTLDFMTPLDHRGDASVLTHPESAGDRTAGEKKSLELRITRAISGSRGRVQTCSDIGISSWCQSDQPSESYDIYIYVYTYVHII